MVIFDSYVSLPEGHPPILRKANDMCKKTQTKPAGTPWISKFGWLASSKVWPVPHCGTYPWFINYIYIYIYIHIYSRIVIFQRLNHHSTIDCPKNALIALEKLGFPHLQGPESPAATGASPYAFWLTTLRRCKALEGCWTEAGLWSWMELVQPATHTHINQG